MNRHLEYIDNKLAGIWKSIGWKRWRQRRDKKEAAKQNLRKDGYKKLEQQLKESGQRQISTSDPDSRHQITRNNITGIFSAQTTVDDKNNIPIDYKTNNQCQR